MRTLIPNRSEWLTWSRPSRLTAIGAALGLVGVVVGLIPLTTTLWPTAGTGAPFGDDFLERVRPGVSIQAAQAVTGAYVRCDREDNVYWWSATSDGYDVRFESVDRRYLSAVTLQVRALDTGRSVRIWGTPFALGQLRFRGLVDCEVNDEEAGSRGLSVSETCHIGSRGLGHDYIFAAYGGVGTDYDFPPSFFSRSNRADRITHSDLADLFVNVVTIKVAGSSPDYSHIDWDEAFSNESDPIRAKGR